MLIIIMLSATLSEMVTLIVDMLRGVANLVLFGECRYAECRYAECH
jgi:hypothetical protein